MNLPSFASATSSIAHKRTRSDELSNHLPSLPQIPSDLLLQVYTHVSLRRDDLRPENHGDNERLACLGKAVFEAAVTSVLFSKRPMLDSGEIQIQRNRVTSLGNLKRWVDIYDMSKRLRCHPKLFSMLGTQEEAQTLFHAYVGAVYTHYGLETAQRWISQLLLGEDAGISPPPTFLPPPKKIKNEEAPVYIPPIFFGSQPPPSPAKPPLPKQVPPPPPPMLPNPLSPAQPGLSFLPLFNQTATQRRVTVQYPADFSGPPHAGRWTVRCVVNGIPKGVGTGSSKQIAKEEAARQAYYAMGWT